MDNNTNTPPTPMPNMQVPADNMQIEKKGNSMVWILVIILIAIVLAAGVYLYMRNQSSVGVPANNPVTTGSTSSLNSLNNELNTADATDNTSDFNQLDQDLQNL